MHEVNDDATSSFALRVPAEEEDERAGICISRKGGFNYICDRESRALLVVAFGWAEGDPLARKVENEFIVENRNFISRC